MKIAVFASGNGSNFQALVDYFKKNQLSATIDWLFCDQPEAYVLQRAKKTGTAFTSFSPKEFASKSEYEQAILEELDNRGIDLIVLAGYMRIVGEDLLAVYENKMINIHPSLLPDFPGLHGIRDAFEAGVDETGVTVHYIDRGVDTGPIIRQEKVTIEKEDTLATLEEKIHQIEHRIFPEVIANLVNMGDVK
ncbi:MULTISPECIES: phosphoribosylglycinamide formyltransferase [Enterococcus]|uniref:Phosphoribosylglycinamide formyltransferase n=1 Tax=Candidatus Enterococcus mangumiae TaxID=2230878 RepID=A0ABZ2SYV1_9ENTE|nr:MULTISPECIES: phosphoribosylglycinamide formyltransferase [unclassified Enterococcus]MBO0460409.1 phosphoribosylglycinamide formyltransferase [Enterococcus sp. DIV1298c]MBO0490753.1 phosphoribosylglycinamide formyltransferase [Enterococcus sp. DIV1094]MBO1298769.1 phosphoribosylglycinamide formyltransferase [Enterococcus sp. DIV1271a]